MSSLNAIKLKFKLPNCFSMQINRRYKYKKKKIHQENCNWKEEYVQQQLIYISII